MIASVLDVLVSVLCRSLCLPKLGLAKNRGENYGNEGCVKAGGKGWVCSECGISGFE